MVGDDYDIPVGLGVVQTRRVYTAPKPATYHRGARNCISEPSERPYLKRSIMSAVLSWTLFTST